jgi:predicted metalloprotease with PDZ domain
MKRLHPIRYTIVPKHPEAHLFEVNCTVADPDPAGQRFALPVWVPGSYLVREFARNIVSIRAQAAGKKIRLVKLDKHTWQAAACAGPLTVVYEIYAWDLSVRAAHLDTTHGFFNGSSVFLSAVGKEARTCRVDIVRPQGARYRAWRVATALPRDSAKAYGFGAYQAADYEELIDHPVEMGSFSLHTFNACGVPHDIVITGRHRCDMLRLAADLKRVCEYQIRLFGEPAPMRRYVFLIMALGEGYGGLEHRASTALMCARDDLPQVGVAQVTEAYRGFLGLASHEYFHTWNVKRIRPAAFAPYDLARENYTQLLWAFEGITSYYDDLVLVRSGLITPLSYLELLGRAVTAVQRGSGRFKQSIAESSFDAWIKYYRQDENAPNAIVSYYLKGSLVALVLDLTIRRETRGRRSLDDVMRALWKKTRSTGRGIGEQEWEAIAGAASGIDLGNLFETAVRGTRELPLEELLADFGIDYTLRAPHSAGDRGGKAAATVLNAVIGARIAADGSEVRLTHVLDGGAAQKAGLAASDCIVALDGLRATAAGFEQMVNKHKPGAAIEVHAFRRDELMQFQLTPTAPQRDTCVLSLMPKTGARAAALRSKWLGQPAGSKAGVRS